MTTLCGDSLKRVERFLEQVIGPAWIPIEFNFDGVARREHAGAFSPSPAICERLLDDACATDGLPSLSKWIPQYAVSDTPEVRASYAAAKQEAARQIQKLRDEYVADPTVLNRIPRLPRTPRTKTAAVTFDVFRMILERAKGGTSFAWTLNDAEDMTHAITGLAHADVVVLDGRWAKRVDGIAPARVFGCGELDAFLDWLESSAAAASRSQ